MSNWLSRFHSEILPWKNISFKIGLDFYSCVIFYFKELKLKIYIFYMPFSSKATILFDLSHNEMLTPSEGIDSEYTDFISLLNSLNLEIKKNEDAEINDQLLKNTELLVIGNPVNEYFSKEEITSIVKFVRHGGSLLLVSEYGADYLQKTNLNDIAANHFNILFESNIIKEKNKLNQEGSSIITIHSFPKHETTNQIREIIVGGACDLILHKAAKPLLILNESTWSEKYNESEKDWEKEEKKKEYIISACTAFGSGKVAAIGDVDIFSNDPNFGINKLDNRKFITNLINWLGEPIEDNKVLDWTLKKVNSLEGEISKLNNKINNIIETISFLEKRISRIESAVTLLKEQNKADF